jgi:hypothetical protein
MIIGIVLAGLPVAVAAVVCVGLLSPFVNPRPRRPR